MPWAQRVLEAELCIQVAAQSAARSCAAKEPAAQPAQVDAAWIPMPAQTLEMKPEAKASIPKLKARLPQSVRQAAQAEPKSPEAQPLASQPARESQAAAEQPALLLILAREHCPRIPQVQWAPWPPEALQPRACWQQEAPESLQADAPQAASHVPAAQPQPLSAA